VARKVATAKVVTKIASNLSIGNDCNSRHNQLTSIPAIEGDSNSSDRKQPVVLTEAVTKGATATSSSNKSGN